MTRHACQHLPLDRRTFLVASGLGFCGLGLPDVLRAAPSSAARPAARSTILVWLSGGASHIDTFDMKPHAPADYRGEFQPIETSAPGVTFCEHLPHLARQAHHLAIVRSLGHYGRGTGDHHAGYYYNLTGHAPDPSFMRLLNNRTPYPTDWPFIGSTVAAKRPQHPYLPQLVTLPEKVGAPDYTRPGQFAARLGLQYDPVYVYGELDRPLDFVVPAIKLQGDVSVDRLSSRRALLSSLDASARLVEQSTATRDYSQQQQKAFDLLASRESKTAFDLGLEPQAVRDAYGRGVNAMSLLLARRLVEAGVPFVTIFWKNQPKTVSGCDGWDTHGDNFRCLREELLPEFDQGFAALIADLHERGLLASTLLLVNSEMGRRPRIGDPRSGGAGGKGRDHWTHCQSIVLAGGGICGGQTYGASDKLAEFPAERPVAPEDVAKTVYHAMGIDDLSATDREGRPFNLLEEGEPIRALF